MSSVRKLGGSQFI